ncbi:hypothetical protein HNQ91_002010 [Filimonas zeae]|uniref:Uncharacterized protein n=1 Tax=Filimonas zeae TaxID=1737353 RepID=A0A917IWX4_9BACT|nr:hypothetical protein [Filimonas zeae]MDR6338959.1 hypothetical protein [Filimonas zeae]GGH65772.1 hypothetical protein GCM10011379_19270 [Filimonas zeae]
MAIDISKLKATPNTVANGTISVTISWIAIADAAADNNVTLELYVDPGFQIYLIDKGTKVKSISWSAAFPFTYGTLQKTFTISMNTGGLNLPTGCSIRLEATSKQGYKSACNSFIIIK